MLEVFLPQYRRRKLGVEVAHDIMLGKRSLEDGGDIGRIAYRGWVKRKMRCGSIGAYGCNCGFPLVKARNKLQSNLQRYAM